MEKGGRVHRLSKEVTDDGTRIMGNRSKDKNVGKEGMELMRASKRDRVDNRSSLSMQHDPRRME